MRVLIVGGGNLGYYLAKNLIESGNHVCLMDKDKDRCTFIADSLGISVVCGDGTRIEDLAEIKAGSFDTFVAATNLDEDNIISCEIAKKQFNIGKTIAKTNNPKNLYIMKKLGIDVSVNTTQIITELIEHEMDGAEVRVIANISNSEAVISEYKIPQEWHNSGKKVSELEMPSECVLVYILRKDELIIPRGDTQIFAGDEIMALTVGNAAKKLKKIFEL